MIYQLRKRSNTRSFYTIFTLAFCSIAFCSLCAVTMAQEKKPAEKAKKKKPPAPFQWVNPISQFLKKKLPKTLKHESFQSPSLDVKVGYYIYLPPEYADAKKQEERYPVVYYLHGGRPGSEAKSVRLSEQIDQLISKGAIAPMIYVFVNGGPVSHYNIPDDPKAQGADIFIKELIPHIDATYRTIASRSGRGLEGFSQGGRGTARLMFRYPELFLSCSPGGGGHATEKKISESGGFENPKLKFAKGDNTWDLATLYSKRRKSGEVPELKILVHVGDKGFNYQNNLQWMKHLTSLDIKHDSIIVADVGHSARDIYAKQGRRLMEFHAKNFANAKNGK